MMRDDFVKLFEIVSLNHFLVSRFDYEVNGGNSSR